MSQVMLQNFCSIFINEDHIKGATTVIIILSGGTTGQELSYHMSPSQASVEDDVSMDSTNTGTGELGDALAVARDKQLISKALDTMARVQCLNGTDITALAGEENFLEFEGPVLQDQHIAFNLQIPTPVPPCLNIHYICESGSRLLFLSVHWARSIPAFQCLRYAFISNPFAMLRIFSHKDYVFSNFYLF